jgi:DNA-binding NtrC family response regulator
VLYQGAQATETIQERDILYKILFDMKKDVGDLKRLVFELLNTEVPGRKLIKEHALLFHSIENQAPTAPIKVIAQSSRVDKAPVDEKIKVAEEENLSIEAKERTLIEKALKRHHNKRKEAARSLGISERTLYRKIKQYDLDQA